MVSIKVTVSVEFLEEYCICNCYIFLVLDVSSIISKLDFIRIESVGICMICNEVVITYLRNENAKIQH